MRRDFNRNKREFRRFDDKPRPVKIGEEYDVKINDVGSKGDGITRVKNFVIFVNGASRGDECRIRIKEVANQFAFADKIGPVEKKEQPAEETEGVTKETEETETSEAEETESSKEKTDENAD